MSKVSIIVPAYNVDKYIEKCLNSLVNQTISNIEIIVINDGSKDGTKKIIDKFAKKYPKLIKPIHKENEGVSVARNLGIEMASGEYIGFVDSDDYIDPSMYEKMYLRAKNGDFDAVACDIKIVYPTNNIVVSSGFEEDIECLLQHKEQFVQSYAVIWNKIYKKSIIVDNVRFERDVWYEDVEFLYKIFPFINKIGVVKEPLYNYLQRPGSITYTYNAKLYDIINNWDRIISFYKDHNLYKDFEQELEYSFVRYAYATFVKRLSKVRDYNKFMKGTDFAIEKVNKYFPNYRKNKYLSSNLKGFYLKHFNRNLSRIVFLFEKNKLN